MASLCTSSSVATAALFTTTSSSSSSAAAPPPRLHTSSTFAAAAASCCRPALPILVSSSSSSSFSQVRRFSPLTTKATSSEDTSSVQVEELFADLKNKWDGLENKSTVLLYGGSAIVAVWLSSILVGAINSVPLLPKIMELVGLGYTGWFVYRYLLFKSSRKELASDIEALKKKIAGTE